MAHNKCVVGRILANTEGYSDVLYEPKYHLFCHALDLGCTVIWIIRLPPNLNGEQFPGFGSPK
jgi:hypothetical protein